jgi:hypothetical protein
MAATDGDLPEGIKHIGPRAVRTPTAPIVRRPVGYRMRDRVPPQHYECCLHWAPLMLVPLSTSAHHACPTGTRATRIVIHSPGDVTLKRAFGDGTRAVDIDPLSLLAAIATGGLGTRSATSRAATAETSLGRDLGVRGSLQMGRRDLLDLFLNRRQHAHYACAYFCV